MATSSVKPFVHVGHVMDPVERAEQAIIEHISASHLKLGELVLDYYNKCEAKGTKYKARFAEFFEELGWDKSKASMFLAIGSNVNCLHRVNNLPPGYQALYELTKVPQELWTECLAIGKTAPQIVAYRKALEEPEIAVVKPTTLPPPDKPEEPEEDWEENAVQHVAEARDFGIDSQPEQVLGVAIIALLQLNDQPTIKAVKSILAKAYHPDVGRIRKDAKLMSDFNRCFDSIERKHNG